MGCSLHDFAPGKEWDLKLFETLFGIPLELTQEFETIFHDLGYIESTYWPERFVNAIQPGADLSGVCDRFNAWRRMDGGYKAGYELADGLVLAIERTGVDGECLEARNPAPVLSEAG